MKAILFLDDDPIRTEAFTHALRGMPCTITPVATATACIMALRAGTFDLVCLDHDLGGEVFVSSGREDCGMEVVRHLVQERHDVGAIIVHSFNGVAAREMEARLREAGYSVTRQLFGGREFYRVIEMLTR